MFSELFSEFNEQQNKRSFLGKRFNLKQHEVRYGFEVRGSIFGHTIVSVPTVAPTAWRTKTTILIYPGGWVEQHPKRSSWHNKEKGGLSPPSNPIIVYSLF